MKTIFRASIISTLLLLVPSKLLAHCPLCTAGAGAAAAGAAMLGVKFEVIGLLIGAFAAALGFYIANRIKRKFFPGQKWVIVIGTFLLTVLPLLPLFDSYTSFTIYLYGDLGTPLNRVYLIDRFLIGSILGGGVMLAIPYISSGIAKLRDGKRFPYQSLVVTFITLVILAVILQLVA